jgi:hypothetical protein
LKHGFIPSYGSLYDSEGDEVSFLIGRWSTLWSDIPVARLKWLLQKKTNYWSFTYSNMLIQINLFFLHSHILTTLSICSHLILYKNMKPGIVRYHKCYTNIFRALLEMCKRRDHIQLNCKMILINCPKIVVDLL